MPGRSGREPAAGSDPASSAASPAAAAAASAVTAARLPGQIRGRVDGRRRRRPARGHDRARGGTLAPDAADRPRRHVPALGGALRSGDDARRSSRVQVGDPLVRLRSAAASRSTSRCRWRPSSETVTVAGRTRPADQTKARDARTAAAPPSERDQPAAPRRRRPAGARRRAARGHVAPVREAARRRSGDGGEFSLQAPIENVTDHETGSHMSVKHETTNRAGNDEQTDRITPTHPEIRVSGTE